MTDWFVKRVKIKFISNEEEEQVVGENLFNSANKIIQLEKQIRDLSYELEIEKKNKSIYELENLIQTLKNKTIANITKLYD